MASLHGMMTHTVNPSTQEGKGSWMSEFEVSLFYGLNSSTTKAMRTGTH